MDVEMKDCTDNIKILNTNIDSNINTDINTNVQQKVKNDIDINQINEISSSNINTNTNSNINTDINNEENNNNFGIGKINLEEITSSLKENQFDIEMNCKMKEDDLKDYEEEYNYYQKHSKDNKLVIHKVKKKDEIDQLKLSKANEFNNKEREILNEGNKIIFKKKSINEIKDGLNKLKNFDFLNKDNDDVQMLDVNINK